MKRLFKITTIILIQGVLLPPLGFAQSCVERKAQQNSLSPRIHINAGFLEQGYLELTKNFLNLTEIEVRTLAHSSELNTMQKDIFSQLKEALEVIGADPRLLKTASKIKPRNIRIISKKNMPEGFNSGCYLNEGEMFLLLDEEEVRNPSDLFLKLFYFCSDSCGMDPAQTKLLEQKLIDWLGWGMRLYQVNTRAFLNKIDGKFADVSMDSFADLIRSGFDFWWMGTWRLSDFSQELNRFWAESTMLPDGQMVRRPEEQIEKGRQSSAFSIDDYKVNPDLGTEEQLAVLREKFHQEGRMFIGCFVPNHFAKDSSLLRERPELFVQMDGKARPYITKKDDLKFHRSLFFQDKATKRWFAHGWIGSQYNALRWEDTVQLDYAKKETRDFMIEKFKNMARMFDGVRVDAAWVLIREHFKKVWYPDMPDEEFNKLWPENEEFYVEAIKEAKKINPNFKVIAEVGAENKQANIRYNKKLIDMGFDYVYDFVFYDFLINVDKQKDNKLKVFGRDYMDEEDFFKGPAQRIRDYLGLFSVGELRKLLVFLENHDLDRIRNLLPNRAHKAMAIIVATLPASFLVNNGQEYGKEGENLSATYIKDSNFVDKDIENFYKKLLSLINDNLFRKGDFEIIIPEESQENVFVGLRSYRNKKALTVVNCCNEDLNAKINMEKLELDKDKAYVLVDELNPVDVLNVFDPAEVWMELSGFQGKILRVYEVEDFLNSEQGMQYLLRKLDQNGSAYEDLPFTSREGAATVFDALNFAELFFGFRDERLIRILEDLSAGGEDNSEEWRNRAKEILRLRNEILSDGQRHKPVLETLARQTWISLTIKDHVDRALMMMNKALIEAAI